MGPLAVVLVQALLVAESARRLERLLGGGDRPLALRWLAVQVLALAQVVATGLALGYAGQLRTPVGQQETYGLHYKRYFYQPGSFVVSRSTAPGSYQPEFTKLVTNYVYSPMQADQPWRGPQLTRLGVFWKWRDYGSGNVSILQPNR